MLNSMIETTGMTPIEVLLKVDKDGYVSGKNLYEFLELDKSNYSKWCKVNILENSFAEKETDFRVFVLKDENPQGGRPTTEYKLTPSFAKKLAMLSQTPRGDQARSYFIACEESIKKIALEHQQWEIERAKGVVIRHILTDTIKMKISDSPHKKFIYPNYTKLIYKTLFGKTMDELRTEIGVKAKESLREHMTADQLQEVESMEMLVSGLINIGMSYDQIKDFIHTQYHPKIAG